MPVLCFPVAGATQKGRGAEGPGRHVTPPFLVQAPQRPPSPPLPPRPAMEAPRPPVAPDRSLAAFPKAYSPEACLQFKEGFHEQVRLTCQRKNTNTSGLGVSKVVVVGDLCVGKTSLINRFCKNAFDRSYKATIGVDFEIERFEILGVPYSLQIWDTAGQEKFKCIASAYYRGAEVIVTVFDLADIQTLGHTKQWLEDALNENSPGSSFIFLVGTKKDLVSEAECRRTEADAIKMANEMEAEYWSVSSKTGENVQAFFSRVAALAFEKSLLREWEKNGRQGARIGSLIQIERNASELSGQSRPNCC